MSFLDPVKIISKRSATRASLPSSLPSRVCSLVSFCQEIACCSRQDCWLLRGILNEFILVPGLFIAAVLGDQVGYWFGAKTGPLIFNRENSLLFRRKNLLAAKAFYEKHGGKTVTLARFLPFIRTFAPIVAGAAEMNYKRFVMFNLLGGFLWAICVTLLGYGLGKIFGNIEGIDKYFTLLVIAFFFIPGLPTLIHLWNDNKDDILAWVKKRLARKQAPEA